MRVIIESLIQAAVMKKRFVVCNVHEGNKFGNEWLQTSHRGKSVITVQVIIAILSIIEVLDCLFNLPAHEGYFGKDFKPMPERFKDAILKKCCSRKSKAQPLNDVNQT
jgi:hypothetical protein